MYAIDITAYANTDNSNKGICKEWGLCRYYGIARDTHDHRNYMEASDIELDNGMDISVKSPKGTLASGNYFTTCKTFEGIAVFHMQREYHRAVCITHLPQIKGINIP